MEKRIWYVLREEDDFGLFLVFSWRVCGWIGGDRLLLPSLGLPWQRGTWFQVRGAATPPPASSIS